MASITPSAVVGDLFKIAAPLDGAPYDVIAGQAASLRAQVEARVAQLEDDLKGNGKAADLKSRLRRRLLETLQINPQLQPEDCL